MAGAMVSNFAEIRHHDYRSSHPSKRSIGQDLGHVVVHQPALQADGADAHEQGVCPHLAARLLREVAKKAVHPWSHDPTEHDKLDSVAIDELLCNIERVRDHREASAPCQLTRKLDGRGPTGHRDRLAVFDK